MKQILSFSGDQVRVYVFSEISSGRPITIFSGDAGCQATAMLNLSLEEARQLREGLEAAILEFVESQRGAA